LSTRLLKYMPFCADRTEFDQVSRVERL